MANLRRLKPWKVPKRLPALYKCVRSALWYWTIATRPTRDGGDPGNAGHDIITHTGRDGEPETGRAVATSVREKPGALPARQRAEAKALAAWMHKIEHGGFVVSEEEARAAYRAKFPAKPTPAARTRAVRAARSGRMERVFVPHVRTWSATCPALAAVDLGCTGMGATKEAASADLDDALDLMMDSLASYPSRTDREAIGQLRLEKEPSSFPLCARHAHMAVRRKVDQLLRQRWPSSGGCCCCVCGAQATHAFHPNFWRRMARKEGAK